MSTESVKSNEPETNGNGIAYGGVFASGLALLAAAACCVLPLVFVSIGIGATALAFLVPYHWPLTVIAGIAIAAGWLLLFRNRSKGGVSGSTIALLSGATILLVLSLAWKSYFEVPLQIWLNA